ncbi:unnamed protein product [Rotaria sordida]|uniref:F-box domain-containing protein n=1 Tax=Rotaria sordida TaxID=392033 RepID=A0A814WFV0_9BILA|nr:unnamed protein product [Rotaria sordida]
MELIHRIFNSLDEQTIILSLRYVCKRIYTITNVYDCYKLNFESILKSNFDRICQFIQPENVILLTLSDEHITSAPDLHIIHLRQLVPEKPLLELPFEDAPLFPKIQSSSKGWYFQKRFVIPIDCVASNKQILPQTLGIRDESVLLGTHLLN